MKPFTRSQLLQFKRTELQAHCKARDIKAAGKNAALVEALMPFASSESVVNLLGFKKKHTCLAQVESVHSDSATATSPEQNRVDSPTPADPVALQNTDSLGSEKDSITLASIKDMVQTAVREAETTLGATLQQRIETLEQTVERQQLRIEELEQTLKQQIQEKANHSHQSTSVPDTPGLHLTRPNGLSEDLQSQAYHHEDHDEVDDAMEAEQVANSLSPLPKRIQDLPAPAPSSSSPPPNPLGDCSSPMVVAAIDAAPAPTGVPTPHRSPWPLATAATSSPEQTRPSTPPPASPAPVATLAAPFSFLQNGTRPPAPISPPRPSSAASQSMPLSTLPHPITFNPFQFSPKRPAPTSNAAVNVAGLEAGPSVSPSRKSPFRRGGSSAASGTGPIRRSRPSVSSASRATAVRPSATVGSQVPPTPASKSSAFGHERTQGSARFTDVGECLGGLYGSASSWKQWH